MAETQLAPVLRHIRRLAGVSGDADLTDAQLLQRFVTRRDETAFAALVERHGRLVWGVCRQVLRHQQDAEDAFQATFLVLARQAAAIHKAEAVRRLTSLAGGLAEAPRTREAAAALARRKMAAEAP
jgi:hypothetical protein